MPSVRPRAAWMAGILTSAVAASVLTGAPAHAVVGEPAPDWYGAVAKLDIDGRRSCSATLVERQWLVTAASCFADDPAKSFKIPAGAPKRKTTATVGRTDLTREDSGTVVDVVELVPREDRDLVMARLARPVDGVRPVRISGDKLLESETVRALGYGRTKDEWVPDKLHIAEFKVDSVAGGTVRLSGKSAGAAVCQGDTGGPALGLAYDLKAVHSTSGQAGCFGEDESETRRTASEARVDDIAGWIRATASRDVVSQANWKNAVHVVAGNFTRRHSLVDTDRKDLFVVWADGSASIFERNDHQDEKRPFLTEHKVAPKDSYWKNAEAVTGTRITDSASGGSSADGLTVRWSTGKLSTYTHVDEYGFFEEKTLAYRASWKNARSIVAGRHSSNGLRDDLAVLWADGSWSTYTDTGVNGVSKETQITGAEPAMVGAQLASGPFTGKDRDDLIVRWKNGMTDLLPGFQASGLFEGDDISLRPEGSAWKYTQILTAGSFGGGSGEDLLVRWADGNLSYYADVDASGTHKEIQLVG
ncbi:trypsin-like serine protease [Streptomyces rectiverticillatus]|uniref:S1 family peptidase n=1 Tax=Streptomyces rectiverticillatus TaxID=173860 RepID=UPI0015C2CD44|nr:trypsin-like serine protease [Streptomyces rectiverticillatus]QLE71810.1 trypsin-like serine protease [Streptomyces rectiverticillatus]